MKKNLVFLVFALVTLGAFAKTPGKSPDPVFSSFAKTVKGGKVNAVIEAKFQKQYGNPANVSWSVVDDEADVQITIATFTEDGDQKEVYYYEDGEVFGIGKSIRRDLLPENVTKAITARFNTGVMQSAYEFKERSSSTRYFVRLVTPKHTMIVSANEFGETRVYQKERTKHLFQ